VAQLAGGVAHEFNNLLTVILGSVDSLRQDAEAGLPADPADVQDVRDSAERARDLTRQLLAFARRQVIQPVVLDLNELLRDVEPLVRSVAGEKVLVRLALQPGLWRVRCDRAQLEQVIASLAAHARGGMPDGGALTLETANVEAAGGTLPAGACVSLVIRDTGAALPAEARARLFEPFFSSRLRGGSAGLGLAMVHGIVRQSGGEIRVEAVPGGGTAIEVLLPRTTGPALAAARTDDGPGEVRGHETVLVVEDEPQVREVTARALRGAGYRVHAARDGQDALQLDIGLLEKVRLLVTDLAMPGLDGRALADALRIRFPELRVLLVSGYAGEAIVQRGVLDESVQFLAKPFSRAELLARVRAILDAPTSGRCGARGGPTPWRPELATGIREIDAQHEELLVQVVALGDAARDGNLSRADDSLAYLERYASEHFSTEERYMREFAYPDREAHRSLHVDFAAELEARKAAYAADRSRATLLVELSGWMLAWLGEHVLGADGEMARFIRSRADYQRRRGPVSTWTKSDPG
jgi:hypothetical protein